jgi:hypothetical protein
MYITKEIDVYLDDFDTEDLIEELKKREVALANNDLQLMQNIYEKRRLGQDYQKVLDDLIYNTIGRIS